MSTTPRIYRPDELPRTLTVRVTADDIAHGSHSKCESCPIALALTRDYPLQNTAYWHVKPARALAAGLYEKSYFIVSKRAAKWMNQFDGGPRYGVAPATFRLRRMDP